MKRIITSYILLLLLPIMLNFGIKANILPAQMIPYTQPISYAGLGIIAFILAAVIARTQKLITYIFIPVCGIVGLIFSIFFFGSIQLIYGAVAICAAFFGFIISKIMHQ